MIGAAFAHLFSVIFLHAYRRAARADVGDGVAGLLHHVRASASAATCCRGTSWRSSRRASAPTWRAWCPGIGDCIVRFMRGGNGRERRDADAVLRCARRDPAGHHDGAARPPPRAGAVPRHERAAERSKRESKKTGQPVPAMPFVPHFALRDLFGWTVALALLAALSAFFPWELGEKADPFAAAPAGIRPEWYFLWMFQALKYAPATVLGVSGEFLVLIPVDLGVVALILLPFLDRNTPRSRRVVKGLATLALIFMIAMTALALLEKAP